jgi:hypothetical protein
LGPIQPWDVEDFFFFTLQRSSPAHSAAPSSLPWTSLISRKPAKGSRSPSGKAIGPGRRRRDDRRCAGFHCLSGQGPQGMACRCRHPRGSNIPANQQGREGSAAANDGSIGSACRQGSCRPRRTRSGSILRPLASSRFPHVGGKTWRVDFQNDGREPTPKRGYIARLCP